MDCEACVFWLEAVATRFALCEGGLSGCFCCLLRPFFSLSSLSFSFFFFVLLFVEAAGAFVNGAGRSTVQSKMACDAVLLSLFYRILSILSCLCFTRERDNDGIFLGGWCRF